jgi:hypothetical protein
VDEGDEVVHRLESKVGILLNLKAKMEY